MTLSSETITDAGTIAKALAHPLRIRIIEAFSVHETLSATQVSRDWSLPLGNVAYHVRRLAGLGIVRLVDEVPRRGAVEHRYQLVPMVLGDLVAVTASLGATPPRISEFGSMLRVVREARGVSHRQLGRRSGVGPAYIAAVELGHANPRLSVAVALADALHATVTIAPR